MNNVLIFLGCVTRDTLTFFSGRFNTVDCFARPSLISLMSEEIPIIETIEISYNELLGITEFY